MLGRRSNAVTAAGIACAIAVAAATLVVRANDVPPRDAVITALVADTDLVAPDFAADALIRLSTSSRITDPRWRMELLDQAFDRTYAAQESYRRASPHGIIPPDSRQGADLFAFDTALNRVSLQVRVAQTMATIDPRRGRERFEWIDLNLAPGRCEDPLVASVDDYYTALTFLARTSFANRGEGLRFLQLYLWRAHLPSEMPAVARALERFRPTAFEATYLEGVLHGILQSSSKDPRGFSASSLDTVSHVADLQKAYRDIGVLNFHLLDTLREYLMTRLKEPRCSDSVTESMAPAAYNGAVVRLGAVKLVDMMDPKGVQPSRMLGTATIDMYWQTPEARRLYEGAIDLRGRGPSPLPMRTRQTQLWRQQAERLLVELGQWTGRSEASERDYLFQKSFLYGGLLELMPHSGVRSDALRSFVEFMRQSDPDRDRRALWFGFLTRLLELARGDDRREVLAALENSHHPVLTLYARIERLGR